MIQAPAQLLTAARAPLRPAIPATAAIAAIAAEEQRKAEAKLDRVKSAIDSDDDEFFDSVDSVDF